MSHTQNIYHLCDRCEAAFSCEVESDTEPCNSKCADCTDFEAALKGAAK